MSLYKCPLQEQAEELEFKQNLLYQMYFAIYNEDYYAFLLRSNEFVYYYSYEEIFDDLFDELTEEDLNWLEYNNNVLRYRYSVERDR